MPPQISLHHLAKPYGFPSRIEFFQSKTKTANSCEEFAYCLFHNSLHIVFYRKAVGHAYANPDEKALVINQGTLNDDYRFYGKLERLDEYGIRFTITQSELPILPVGTVYEFERSY